jgi:3-hydroxymyristoyl/3-hydroxydecanoyl-(acyl carrier protein) dehydratase
MRWLLLEKVHSIQKGKRAAASARVPKAPYSPEVLFIEMMAQTGGLLVGAESDYQKDLVFAKIETATITIVPKSGTPLEIEAWSESLGAEGGWLEATITCAEGPVAQAKLLLMAVSGLSPQQTKSITFHEAFMDHFDVRGKIVGSAAKGSPS